MPRCQQDNPVLDAQFCPRCGTPVKHDKDNSPPAASYAEVTSAMTEALAQQKATSEILRVIASSPTDVVPTFEAIATAATRLCAAQDSGVVRFDGVLMHLIANDGFTPEEREVIRALFPRPADRGMVTGRPIVTRSVAHVSDITEDPEYDAVVLQRGRFMRTMLSVPMLRDGEAVGAITVTRREAEPFSDSQIALLETFARQAAIAIENVRLFTELETRNSDLTTVRDQQTATSEILRVISSSPTDVQPVFDAIAVSARRLCDGTHSAVLTYDGSLIHLSALDGVDPQSADSMRRAFPMPPGRASSGTRAILYREVVQVPDVFADAEYVLSPQAKSSGFRSVVAVPMLREGAPIGSINVARATPRVFPDSQVELLKTFADQAVIAIENVRLFKELETRNRDLTTALDQQTATSDILKVISSSPTDEKPVFQAIADSSVRLCAASFAVVATFDGETLHLVAHKHVSAEGDRALAATIPCGRTAGKWPVERSSSAESSTSRMSRSITSTWERRSATEPRFPFRCYATESRSGRSRSPASNRSRSPNSRWNC